LSLLSALVLSFLSVSKVFQLSWPQPSSP
jgi:hypothetical protein